MKVNSRYLAINGNTSDVGGRIFDTSNRNTTSDSKMLMPSVTCKKPARKRHTLVSFLPFLLLLRANRTPERKGTKSGQSEVLNSRYKTESFDV